MCLPALALAPAAGAGLGAAAATTATVGAALPAFSLSAGSFAAGAATAGAASSFALPFSTSALMTAGRVFSIASTVMGAYKQSNAQRQQALYNARIAQNNARVAEMRASDAKFRGEEAAKLKAMRTSQLFGAQRAAQGKSGVLVGQGSAGRVTQDTLTLGQLDQGNIRYNADVEAYGFGTEAENFRTTANLERATARSISPGFAALTGLLESAGPVAAKWYARTNQ